MLLVFLIAFEFFFMNVFSCRIVVSSFLKQFIMWSSMMYV